MKKRWRYTMMSFLVFSLGFIGLAVEVHPIFAGAAVASLVVHAIAFSSFSCPACGYAVFYREQRAFGMRFHAAVPGIPDTCPGCGKPIT